MERIRIHKDIEIIDCGLYLTKHKTLIFSDFHMGCEESLNAQGALIPRFQLKDTLKRLDTIFTELKKPVNHIILNGDIKHEFGRISQLEWREVLKLIDYLQQKCENITIIKGNHDTILPIITQKRNVKVVRNIKLGNILIAHGDTIDNEAYGKAVKTIIIGHEHPAIGIREGKRVERFKCYLKGSWKRKRLILQPSFNTVQEGSDILKGKFLSPYLSHSIDNFEIWVIADKPRYFGRVKDNR